VIIDVDLSGATAAIELLEPGDCKAFHVAARGGNTDALAAALSAASVGRLLPSGDAMIDTGAVRLLAHGKVPAGWDDDFTAMLEYAGSKGWLDDSGGAVQAHVEWAP
jgi:hypothetical protein